MNSAVAKKVRQKHVAWNRYIRTRDASDYRVFAKARNQTRNATRKAVKNFEKTVAAQLKDNPKLFWRYVKSKTKTNPGISDLNVDGRLTESDEEKAEVLNQFFTSVFTIEGVGDIPVFEDRFTTAPLTDFAFSVDDVKKLLRGIKISSSPGPDNVHSRILKECADVISPGVQHIFRLSLDTGVLPNEWKLGRITPIFKKGSRRQACNYRPVSLTSILCKVFEKLIRKAIVNHMKVNSLFSPHQHGFIGSRSCMTQMLETLELWTIVLEGKGGLDAIYLDFLKAFDTVPHRRLLVKLKGYGIQGRVLAWNEAFLSGRQQQVAVNE